ncbi:neural Wiskott-Aldrich syndrome protein isoform X2 [Folsomia candida]|uniref:neural Wiskott-Aldrich syndrome protein isoform X2 n=1 Tax=Folsomia candida TaxID=158441 RepID=UPI000B8FB5A1|nr:neural Wiskott-Aldrich syndrome protein isoform X2 [Folsomia candida]
MSYIATTIQLRSPSASSPGTTRSPGYGSSISRDDSFEADVDVDIPPAYDMSSSYNNNSYSSQHPPAIPENPPTPRRPPPDNKTSLLLSREENQVIFDILGKGRQTLASAVAQLLVPTPDQSRWQIKETGVACLVRDTTKKSYFIQVFSLGTRSMVFRQEIYNQFEYNLPNHCFLTFEGDSSTVGILFADPTEAGLFREGLDSKLEAKRQRRNEREHRRSRLIPDNHGPPYPQSQSHNNQPQPHPQKQVPSMTNGVSTVSTTYNFPTKPNSNKAKTNNKKDKNKKPTLRKEDIGQPMDFRHVQHVGWDPNKGFDLNGVDSDLRVFFEKAGVSSDVLQDENTRQFIYNFIEQNGGLEQIRNTSRPAAPFPPPAIISNPNPPPPPVPNRTVQALKPAAPPPPPSRPVPPVPGYNQGVPPPPPPMRTSSSNVVEKSPSHQVSSPNLQNSGPARPPPPTFANSNPKQPSHSNGPIPPPPPPPPPMPVAGMPPPPPPPPMGMPNAPPSQSNSNGAHNNAPKSSPPVMDDRSNLLAQIQKGVNLKKVDPSDTPPKRSAGGLADCLNQIQTGVALKPVQQTQKEPQTTDTMDGLAGALARALAERSKAINPDSSSEEEEEAEDDEWD